MKLLLFSNSTNIGEDYLSYTIPFMKEFINSSSMKGIFVPFAAVTFSYDKYFQMVSSKISQLGIELKSVHLSDNPKQAISDSEIIIVGGGNTFALLKKLQELDLIEIIQKSVRNNALYIGWSAGSNVACPSIKTTNDMPIVQPDSFNAINLIPFQINPHYTDETIKGHGGESRETRINEFLTANPDKWVVGLKEGTLFEYSNSNLSLKGNNTCKVFKFGVPTQELNSFDDLNFLMQ
jgi:dipeptidase E